MYLQHGYERSRWEDHQGQLGPAKPAEQAGSLSERKEWTGSHLEQRRLVPTARGGWIGRGAEKGRRGKAGQGRAERLRTLSTRKKSFSVDVI